MIFKYRYHFGDLWKVFVSVLICIVFIQCTKTSDLPVGDPDNAGLFLPGDFEAIVVVDSLKGRTRHIAVSDRGDIYAKLRFPDSLGGNAAIRVGEDGKANIIKTFNDYQDRSSYGTEMRIHNGYLYFSSVTRIFRQKLTDELVPDTEMELILTDHHPIGQHDTKPLAFDKEGNMYVPFGAPSDACQKEDRSFMSPGMDPCPILETQGGIWRFDASKKGQTQEDGHKFATGLRSVVALQWNHESDGLYTVVHGRDYLHSVWPNHFSAWEGAVLPAEVFLRLEDGSDAGWPYYYYDQLQEKYFLNPEYGGDGKKQGDSSDLVDPLVGFLGHFAPNDLLFYTGDQFPDHYKNGAFIAFHGSTSSAPYPQSGYFVAFVPMKNGQPTGDWEVFADGFTGVDIVKNTSDAEFRPMGLAQGPDGSLYISDSEKGRIWRIMYKGDKKDFGEDQLVEMEKRKLVASNIKTPVEGEDIVDKGEEENENIDDSFSEGRDLFNTFCAVCHQKNGKGNDRFPPLYESDWVSGDTSRLIKAILEGLEGEIVVNGKSYNNVMPPFHNLKDEEIAEILTYIRKNFNNNSEEITKEDVAKERK